MSNKIAKEQVIQVYGYNCMITDYTKELNYHHIKKRCKGGRADLKNGSLLYIPFHSFLHNVLEQKHYQLYKHTNEVIIAYKRLIISPREFNTSTREDIYQERQYIKSIWSECK